MANSKKIKRKIFFSNLSIYLHLPWPLRHTYVSVPRDPEEMVIASTAIIYLIQFFTMLVIVQW